MSVTDGATASNLPLGAILAAIAVGSLVWAAWATIAWRRSRLDAFAARLDRSQALALADGWYWQTDAAGRLTALSAPAAALQVPTAWQGRPVWDLIELQAPTPPGSASDTEVPQAAEPTSPLRQRLALQANLVELACRWKDSTPPAGESAQPPRWVLSATPQHDARGQFRGYLGRVRELPPATLAASAASSAPAAPAAAGSRVDDDTTEGRGFTYTVSHDLRAPIRVVEGFTRIVKEDYGHLLDRVGIDHLDRVLSAAARMNAMIDALLALSRISQQPLTRQTVNLSQIAGFIVDDLQRAHPEHRVEVQIAPGLTAQGDPTLLRMALENLLGNAWKYTGKTREPRIWLEADPKPDAGRAPTVFRVRDNGAGFDMRFADRLFGVFQRLHGASEFPGTGVGLASVRRIVRRHGGEIWAESEPGRGAVFHFTLGPAAARE